MSVLKMEIKQIKSLEACSFEIPIERGIYCIVGANGSGKSTILSCLAQTVYSSSLNSLNEFDYNSNSYVNFSYNGASTKWSKPSEDSLWRSDVVLQQRIHFNGMYEGSLFYGTRFADSLIIDDLVKNGTIPPEAIVPADDYIKEKLSYILRGDLNHYKTLKRIRNKRIAQEVNLKNTPYFQDFNNHLVSQYRMSSGECLLISLLHFVYNALIRRSLPDDQPILMLIDEIELALHPVAVSRLIDLLNGIIQEHENLTVILTTHSPEVIHKISPSNLFFLETIENNSVVAHTPCYPSYAIRDVYMHDGFDYVILVEDLLAKYVVESTIKKLKLNSSKLINILPVGGWENVLKFQDEAYKTNTFGIGTTTFSVLDGDIKGLIGKPYKKLPKTFLPIKSIEKYLYAVITEPNKRQIKKEINDTFFSVESIDSILADYYKEGDNNGKALYRKLLSNLLSRNISEEVFVKELCSIVMEHENFSSFEVDLTQKLSN